MKRLAPVLWVLGASLIALLLTGLGVWDGAEARLRDRLLGLRVAGEWPADLLLVPIDDDAIADRGPWPWSWTAIGGLLTRLDALGAKTVVVDAALPDLAPGESIDAFAHALGHTVLPVMLQPGLERPADDVAALRGALLQFPNAGPRSLTEIPLRDLATPPAAVTRAAAALGGAADTPDADGHSRFVPAAFGFEDDPGVLPQLGVAALIAHRALPAAGTRIAIDRLAIPGLPAIPLAGAGIPLDFAPAGDDPPSIGWRELTDPSREDELAGRVRGKLVLVYQDDRSGFDRVLLLGKRPVPHGIETATVIRTLESGRPPMRLPPAAALRLLTLLAIVVAMVPVRPRPAAVASIGVAFLGATVLAGLAAAHWAGLLLPLCNIGSWTVLVGAALVFHSARGVEHRLRRAESRADAAKAPKGRVALVFTDVQGSTRLWDRHLDAMRAALELHDRAMREAIEKHGGYEVKTEGDAFMIAFPDAVAALKLCVEVQRGLLGLDWPPEILSSTEGAESRSPEGALLFRGLRVRMGIHTGEPECVPDPKTGRMDYFGPVVNRAARVSSAASGGQIVVSADAWREIQERKAELPAFSSRDLGAKTLKGIESPERLTEILPEELAGRSFAA